MPQSKTREIAEGPQHQGVDEIIVYTITTTKWVSSPTLSAVVVKLVSDGSDVTSVVMPSGSGSESGDVITLPALKLLTAAEDYKVEVKFTAGGNTYECYIPVHAEV